MGLQLTFINTSDGPNMGLVEAKQMRAHVTKTNFAKRRKRLVQERQSKQCSKIIREYSSPCFDERASLNPQFAEQRKLCASDLNADWPLLSVVHYTTSSVRYLLREFRPLVFPQGTGAPGSATEAAWIHLLQSEPALVEACVAIGLKHCPRHQHIWGPREAAIRKGRAIQMINQRLDTPSSLTDGLLSAVFTLTYAEYLGNDPKAMQIHIQGLAQMIRLRRSSGDNNIPAWFSDFLLCDSMGHSITSPHGLHKQLIQAIKMDEKPNSMDIAHIRSGIDRLRQDIDVYHATRTEKEHLKLSIEYQVECLQSEVEILLQSPEHHIRTLRRSLQLFLLLLWPYRTLQDLNVQAEELRRALTHPHIRLCTAVELPIWQLSVGAAAAQVPGETRSWYIARLRELFITLNVGVLDKGVASLGKTFMPDALVLGKFKVIWQESSRSS